MIVSFISDPTLRVAARRAARPDEDIVGGDAAWDALRRGYPRAVLHFSEGPRRPFGLSSLRCASEVPIVLVTRDTVAAWDARRRAREIPGSRVDDLSRMLGGLIRQEALRATWVEGALRDLTLALGRELPPAFRGLSRRVLEYPARYLDLGSMAGLSRLSRGALKARFRRRGLASPFLYLRLLRVTAAAHVLRSRSSTIVEAADHLGFTTSGNLCRYVALTTGLTPSDLREASGWGYLLTTLADRVRQDGADAWATLDDIFLRVA